MSDPKQSPEDTSRHDKSTPDVRDVEPGSDADETPIPEAGQTPPDPNETKT